MGAAAVTKYQNDEIILHQGSTDKCLYKIISGRVALYTGYGQPDEYLVGILSAPNCFGEMTVLAEQPSYYTVVALETTLVLQVSEENFDAFIQNNYQNAITIMKTMAKNLSMMNMNIKMLTEELTELTHAKTVDTEALKHLVDICASQNVGMASLPDDETAAEFKKNVGAAKHRVEGLYPPGHAGYPGITHREYRDYVFKKQFTCPNCQKSFEGWQIFQSKLAKIPVEPSKAVYELHTAYRNFEKEWYDIITCPHCLFSALESRFQQTGVLRKAQYEEELDKLHASLSLNFSAERDIDFVFAQHYLALVCAAGFSDFRQIKARIWMNLLWLYKTVNDQKMTGVAWNEALAANREVYINCHLMPAQEQSICITIASMLYQGGKVQEAKDWALKAQQNSMGSALYSGMARCLLEDIAKAQQNQP